MLYLQNGFDIFDFFGGLTDIISGFIAAIEAQIVFLAQLIYAVFVYLFNLLLAIAKFLLKELTTVYHFFLKIKDLLLDKVIRPIIKAFTDLQQWLRDTLGPVLKYLNKMRAWYDQYFNKYVKPFLNVISHIRQVLTLLKLLHVKWAGKLDGLLGKVQSRVFGNFEKLRQRLNQVISWLDLIIDPRGIIRAGPLANSIGLSIGTIVQTVTGRPLSYYQTHDTKSVTNPALTPSATQNATDMAAAANGASNFYSDQTTDARTFYTNLTTQGPGI